MVRQNDGSRRSSPMRNYDTEERWSLPGEHEGGYLLRKSLDRLLRPATTDHAGIEDVLLSASEAFSNAVRHGSVTPQDEIRVVLALGPGGCRLTLHYRGEPFDVGPPQLPDSDSTGGRGRWLMAELCDSVEYEFAGGMTCIRLTKRWS